MINYDPDRLKHQNNYFTSMLKRFQDGNIVWHLKPEQIQKSAKERIFKEIVKGQIDYSQFGQYFTDPKFLENLLIAANDELNNNTVVRDALIYKDFYLPGDPDVTRLKVRYGALVYIFQIIISRINAVKMTGDVGFLTDIQFVLEQWKNQF